MQCELELVMKMQMFYLAINSVLKVLHLWNDFSWPIYN